MNVTIGSAPDSWGVWFPEDDKQTPASRFLDEVAEAGYEWTELGPYGYLPTDARELRRQLDARGLGVCAAMVMTNLEDPDGWSEVERQTLGSGALAAALGAKFLLLIDDTYTDLFTGEPVAPKRLDEASWQRFLDTCARVGELARYRFDLTTVFHPHAETHVEYEGQIEAFMDATDPGLVSICLDVGHHAYRGGDPVAFMRKHHERIPYLHLKNVDEEIRKEVEAEGIPFAKAVAMDMFCEPGVGAVDYRDFRDVLNEIDFSGWAVVEQDIYPAPWDKPLPIARRTRQYLRDIGIG